MTGDLTRRQQNIILAVWLLGWAAVCLLAVWIGLSGAATLQISGNATGNGSQLFRVVGGNITAFFDGFRWNVTGAM